MVAASSSMRSASSSYASWSSRPVAVLSLILLSASGLVESEASIQPVLDEGMMQMTWTAAYLSNLAYEVDPAAADAYEFNMLRTYNDEPDQVLVAQRDGYCYVAFRGTTLSFDDWLQNLDPREESICPPSSPSSCCTVRNGFWSALLEVNYLNEMYQSLQECISSETSECSINDSNDCVVFTGHSQGGAVASVAALYWPELDPFVITFGGCPVIDAPCSLIRSDRWYRYINTRSESDGIEYDIVPFIVDLGADEFGHMLVLSDDETGVAYYGLDTEESLWPLSVEAHKMAPEESYVTYLDRMDTIIENGQFPLRTNGFVDGSMCSTDLECVSEKCEKETFFSYATCVGSTCSSNDDCVLDTDRCDSGKCMEKLGACGSCDEHSDCQSGNCPWTFTCTDPVTDKSPTGCRCIWDSDCESGRCEGTIPPYHCEDKLPNGSSCNEDSDCESDYCSWWFKCEG